MHIITALLALFVAIFALSSVIASRPRGAQLTALANIGEGFQPKQLTFLTDAALTTRYLLGKIGSDSGHIATTGVSDIPLGIIADEAAAAELGVSVHLLGIQDQGLLGVASGSIAAGDLLVPGATGTLRTLPATTGTYYIVGRALKAAATTENVEFIPTFPVQRVVA